MKRPHKKRLFALLLLTAALVGGARGWIHGVQEALPGSRDEGMTVKIEPNEIGIKIHPWSGAVSTLEGAGYHWALPGLAEVYRISSVPRTLVFGQKGGPARLDVRSADGSGFYFEEVRIDFRVSSAGAQDYLADSGLSADAARRFVGAFARPILCEEFGRHTVQEVTDALVRDVARSRALDRLAAELEPHGIELIDVTTGKLSFDRDYETAIGQRKVADQEVERLTEALVQKEREREKRLTSVRSEIDMRNELMDGELARKRTEAQTAALKARTDAEAWSLKHRAAGEVQRDELLAQAVSVEDSVRKTVAAFQSELAALEGRGLAAVRERLVQSLAGTRFKLTPFTQDASPERVERIDVSN
ncbi:MAG: SPFH domain-containing protein [Planctomycetota bacterium]|nr:SPFH domain-containing protein [Planctomycetota bacterium]